MVSRQQAGTARAGTAVRWFAASVRGALSRLGSLLRAWRRDTLPELPAKIKKAFPVAAFFIVLFWFVVGLFGMSHVMPVSCYTTLFNVRHRKYNTAGQYLRFFFVSYLALAAARIATLNVILCIGMNVIMPFIFVFMRSSQLNPRRYFPYMMLFVFLQLRPELLDNLLCSCGPSFSTTCSSRRRFSPYAAQCSRSRSSSRGWWSIRTMPTGHACTRW